MIQFDPSRKKPVPNPSDQVDNRYALSFSHFPAYAKYLLENKIDEFVIEQLRLFREMNVPMMKYFTSYTEEQLIIIGRAGVIELLNAFAQNKVKAYIDQSVHRWLANQMPLISRDEIVLEDISLVNFIRRKIFRHFISAYTSDMNKVVEILDEVDNYTSVTETIAFNKLFYLQQDLYRQAQSLAKVGNWIWDLKSNSVFWSEEIYKIHELNSRDEITYEKTNSFIHPDDEHYVKEETARSIETRIPHNFYYRIKLPGGTEKILHAKGEIKLNETGKPYQLLGTLQDVTEQKLNEYALQEKQNFVQKIANVTPSLIAAYNVNTGKYIFINNAIKTLLGYEHEDVLNNGIDFFTNIIHQDDLQPLLEKQASALESANRLHADMQEAIVEFQYRLRHKNGTYRWFHTYGTVFNRNKDNRVEEVINISMDVTESYNLNSELEERKAFAELLIDSSVDLIGAFDINQNFIAWNKRCEEIYHLKKEEVLGKNIYDIFPQLAGSQSMKDLALALSGTPIHHSEKKYEIQHEGFHETFVIPLKNRQGEIFGALTVSHDVTELKNRANALQELNASFFQAEKIANMSHWQWNLETGKLTYSDNQYQLVGCEPQSFEPTLENYLKYIHPEDHSLVLQAGEEVTNGLEPTPVSFRVIRKDGALRYFYSEGMTMTNQFGEKLIIGINRDVTKEYLLKADLENAREKIRVSEDRYHKMIDEIQDYAILLLDKDGTILNWNKGAQKIKGYTAEEAIGKNFQIFYTEEDQRNRKPLSLIKQAIENNRASDEGWRVRKDGSKFWCSIYISPLHDENNKIIGFTKVTRDLTEKKLSEDKLLKYANYIERKNEQLESSNAELASFTYIASHDLREPLRKIKIFTNRIAEGEMLPGNAKDYFNRIISASDRMQNLIDALLSYSRVNSTDLIMEHTDLNVVLKEVKESLADEIEEKKGVIESAKLPVVKIAPLQFHQLFINIIGNSIKYSKKDVPLHVKLSVEEVTSSIIYPASGATKYYKIDIADNGIGFDQKYADKVFELFQRLHNRGEFEGTGIGLAICKKIVQNHNGIIKVTSATGVGTTFSIYLPMQAMTELYHF